MFLVGSAVLVIRSSSWFLPHVELRSASPYDSRGEQDAADAAVAAETEAVTPGLSH